VSEYEATDEEWKAIRALERLAKKWPRSIGLYSMSGSLCVMPTDDAIRIKNHGSGEGLDQDAIITTIQGISNDGGDW
jgi:hypothetical protein